ncbi:hypothetical protein EB118_05200 [bacterium]|nr:hypothetical protein [Actinomycetota bacterium]NDG29481.1 hypothetical protein [bacterium]
MKRIFVDITKSIRPSKFAVIQCDGSYSRGMGRTAVLYKKESAVTNYTKFESSTEAEWKSVHDALLFGISKDLQNIGIENDCLGITYTFLNDLRPKKEYARYYKWKIIQDSKQTEWTGIRWIPRRDNLSDSLFMKHLK